MDTRSSAPWSETWSETFRGAAHQPLTVGATQHTMGYRGSGDDRGQRRRPAVFDIVADPSPSHRQAW